jgi:putative phosphoribosyl transferase
MAPPMHALCLYIEIYFSNGGSTMMFKNRREAAELLLKKLMKYKGENVIVVGIPRGGMPLAKIIANGLHCECTAVLVHKIPAPENVELAIGCVGLSGHIHSLKSMSYLGVEKSYIDKKAQEQLDALREIKERYSLSIPSFEGKTVILVDDGIATGATTLCAVHEIRSLSPEKIILAIPVASQDAAVELRFLVDEFIVLFIPPLMYSIGQFYEEFEQVSDEEVILDIHGRQQWQELSTDFQTP